MRKQTVHPKPDVKKNEGASPFFPGAGFKTNGF
jgi:hypothetical protein